jgi:hypothetical protein
MKGRVMSSDGWPFLKFAEGSVESLLRVMIGLASFAGVSGLVPDFVVLLLGEAGRVKGRVLRARVIGAG